MKYFVSLFLITLFSLNANAIEAIHRLFPISNADGTTVMLYKHGNGHLAFYTTPEDRVVVRNAQGMLCYAAVQGDSLVPSTMNAHNLEARTAEEKLFVENHAVTPQQLPAAVQSASNKAPDMRRAASTADGLGQYGTPSKAVVPSIGDITIPVIMVQFSDKTFRSTTTPQLMTRFYNEEGFSEATDGGYIARGSVKDYFRDQSRGMFVPTFDVVATVTLSKSYSYYGKNNEKNNDSNAWAMLCEAVSLASSQGVDFNKYKNASTNNIPLISILYAGEGEATSYDENCIWPHFQAVGNSYDVSGYKVGGYFMGNEVNGSYLMGMGVFVHEFGHALGLPDFYCTNSSYTNDSPFGLWSVMDCGCYNENAYNPVGYTAYERSFMGWLDIKEMTEEQQGIVLSSPNDNNNFAVLLRNPTNTLEYYILENRQPGTWSPAGTGSGLMLTHVKYYSDAWINNYVNNTQSKKRCLLLTADGSTVSNNASTSHLYGNGVSDLETLPLYNGTTLTGYPFYQIIKHSDGTISLCYKARNLYSETASNGTYYQRVDDLSQLNSKDEVLIVNEDERMAIGTLSSANSRMATTIQLDGTLAYGTDDVLPLTAVKTTDGKSWGLSYKSGSQTYYLCVGKNGALTVTNKAASTCMANVSIADGKATITFGGTYTANTIGYTTDNTCFRCVEPSTGSNVSIYRKVSDPTSVHGVSQQTAPAAIYSLSGIRLEKPQRGVNIINGRKVVK